MPQELRNIMEYIVRLYLDNALTLYYDICTCKTCKQDMLGYVVSKIPAEYMLLNQSEEPPPEVMVSLRDKYKGEIIKTLMSAIDIVSKNPSHPLKENKGEAFQALLDRIYQERGLDFRQYNPGVIKRKIAVRIRKNGLESYGDYARFLTGKPQEYEELLAELCINVSEFFRDPEVWVSVRCLLENMIAQKKLNRDNSIVIWSAGCASGEEPYAIAIELSEILKSEKVSENFSIKIYATDIDRKCLCVAAIGIYPKQSLKNVDERYLKDYFIPLPEGSYQIKDGLKEMVTFRYLDLVHQEYIRDTDMVFCRNVFIYFNRDLQEQLLMKFYKSLRPGGYLIKGKTEAIFGEARHIFADVDSYARIYRRQQI
jgi:chemotaxis protein methyltransferase CheR